MSKNNIKKLTKEEYIQEYDRLKKEYEDLAKGRKGGFMKYRYELLNNHYVADIDGDKFLIDTGNPFSFQVDARPGSIIIDGRPYPLTPRTRLNTEEKKRKTYELIGCPYLDGFIGTDIIKKTGLTIYKDGWLEFAIKEVPDGVKTRLGLFNFDTCFIVDAHSNGISGPMVIDLGATVGYAIPEVFNGEEPYCLDKYDHNPEYGKMESPMYHQQVTIAGRTRIMDMGYHEYPMGRPLGSEVPFVGSVTNFFEEVCVFDTRNWQLILK